MEKFNFDRFMTLKRASEKRAEEYRLACFGREEKVTESDIQVVELSRDDIKAKLTKAWIEYFGNAKTVKLVELMKENNLA